MFKLISYHYKLHLPIKQTWFKTVTVELDGETAAS